MEINKPYNQITIIEYLFMLLQEAHQTNQQLSEIITKLEKTKKDANNKPIEERTAKAKTK